MAALRLRAEDRAVGRETTEGRGAGADGAATRAKAEADYADLVPVVAGLKAEGLSLRQVAGCLNAEGHAPRWGRPWNAMQVARILVRAVA